MEFSFNVKKYTTRVKVIEKSPGSRLVTGIFRDTAKKGVEYCQQVVQNARIEAQTKPFIFEEETLIDNTCRPRLNLPFLNKIFGQSFFSNW